jgi:RNA polymerase sigma-70 factor, ECF subfamily
MNGEATYETMPARNNLWSRPIEGNHAALEELFSRYRGRLYSTALRVLGNPDDAEDALQDGMLAAFRSLNTFEGRSQLSTWLTRIVVNAALMQRRRCRVSPMVSIDQSVQQDNRPLAEDLCDPAPNPEEIYIRREQLQRLEQALRAVSEVRRRAWWLRHVQGLKIREIAAIVGLPVGTLKSQLSRVRRMLRREVRETRRTMEVVRGSRP